MTNPNCPPSTPYLYLKMDLFELAKTGAADIIKGNTWTAKQLDQQDEHGRTALMYAAMAGHYRAIEALKAAGADLDITDFDGRKAVHHAARNGHGISIIYLIEGGCGG